MDWYKLLGVTTDACENTIKKAYRKKALSCHPDKNPDNPKAAELFHQLSQALSVLTNEDERNAFDNLLNAKKANKIRNDQLDAKRKKMKDDLEVREKAAQTQKDVDSILTERKLAAEIERLQKEGKRQLEEENEKIRKKMEEIKLENLIKQTQSLSMDNNSSIKLKVRWKELSKFSNNSIYNEDSLGMIFCKYGDVGEIIVLPNKKKPGSFSGLIEMKSIQSAKMAVNIETGFQENPFRSVKLLE